MKLGILKMNEVRIRAAPLIRNITNLPDDMFLVAIRNTIVWDIYFDIKETLLMRRNETW